MTQHVGLYCRFSTFKDGGSENVEDQETWGREYAAETWPGRPVEVFVDDGITAADDDAYRAGFERLREWLADGRLGHLWTVEQTRLCRTNRWFSFADELEAAGIVKLHSKREGVTAVADLASDVRAVIAKHEVRRLKERVNDKLDILATQGRPSGGTTFGYRHDIDPDTRQKVLTVVPEQAELVREVAARVLDGEPLSSIASDVSSRGVKGARGGAVGPAAIRSWVTSPTMAGKRQHRGQIVGEGNWQPILGEDVWQACRAILARMTERKERPGQRTYLLSGIVHCGVCEGRMTGAIKYSGGGGQHRSRPSYECKTCNLTMSAEAVDGHVSDELLSRLDELIDLRSPADENEARRAGIARELGVVDEKRRLYGRMLADDEMDAATYTAARERLTEQERALTAELAEMPAHDDEVDPDAVRLGWAGNTVEERRQLIGLFVDRVVIDRARPGAPRKVDLGRVRIEGPGWPVPNGTVVVRNTLT